MTQAWHLYLLCCRDGSMYAGITTDIERRFREHAEGRGARYTRSHPPEAVLGSRSYPDRASASRAEHALKRQPKARKLAWLLAGSSSSAGCRGIPAEPAPGSDVPVTSRTAPAKPGDPTPISPASPAC